MYLTYTSTVLNSRGKVYLGRPYISRDAHWSSRGIIHSGIQISLVKLLNTSSSCANLLSQVGPLHWRFLPGGRRASTFLTWVASATTSFLFESFKKREAKDYEQVSKRRSKQKLRCLDSQSPSNKQKPRGWRGHRSLHTGVSKIYWTSCSKIFTIMETPRLQQWEPRSTSAHKIQTRCA